MKSISILGGLFVSTLVLAGCGEPAAPSEGADEAAPVAEVTASNAWCRPSPNGAKAGACYVTLMSETDDRLMGGKTPFAAALEVHDMTTEGGVMRMSRMGAGMELRQGQAVMLAPGGKHLMLIELTQPLVAGETVPLTLEFASAPAVTVQAIVGQGPSGSMSNMSH